MTDAMKQEDAEELQKKANNQELTTPSTTPYVYSVRVKERWATHKVSAGAMEALNKAIEQILDKASERCRQNGRNTIQAQDI